MPEEKSQEGDPAAAAGTTEQSPTAITGQQGRPDLSAEAVAGEMLALERARDAQRNTETRPPDGETVSLRSVTVAEVYVGHQATALTAAIREVEWVNIGEPIAEMITEALESDTYNSAEFVLVEPDSELTLRGYGKLSLPAGVGRIYGSCYVLGPSITAMVLTFVLTDAEGRRFDSALRDDAQSSIDKTGSTRFFPKTVYHVKSERIRVIRDELSKRCLLWFKETFPGVLLADDGPAAPVCSLLSLTEGKPFQMQTEYMRLLDLTNAFLASRFARPDFLFLTSRIGRSYRREFIAAFNEADALSPGSYPDLSVMPEILHGTISIFMLMQAIQGVLGSFELRMRGIRSELEKLDFDRATESQVLQLRNRLLGTSRDIAIVCGDVTVVVDDAVEIWADYPLLIPMQSNQSSSRAPENTADVTRRNLRSLITNLQAREAGLRELVLITSQSINDAQNIQLQNKVLILTDRLGKLTIWLVILTLALVFIGIVQLVNSPSTNTRSPGVSPHASTPATSPSTLTPATPSRT